MLNISALAVLHTRTARTVFEERNALPFLSRRRQHYSNVQRSFRARSCSSSLSTLQHIAEKWKTLLSIDTVCTLLCCVQFYSLPKKSLPWPIARVGVSISSPENKNAERAEELARTHRTRQAEPLNSSTRRCCARFINLNCPRLDANTVVLHCEQAYRAVRILLNRIFIAWHAWCVSKTFRRLPHSCTMFTFFAYRTLAAYAFVVARDIKAGSEVQRIIILTRDSCRY